MQLTLFILYQTQAYTSPSIPLQTCIESEMHSTMRLIYLRSANEMCISCSVE